MNRLFLRRRWAEHWQTYRIYPPVGGVQAPDSLQELLTVLWGRSLRSWWRRIREGQPWLAYEVWAEAGGIQHLWGSPGALGAFLRDSLAAYRPGVVELANPVPVTLAEHVAGAVLRMKRPACYALTDRPVGAALERALSNLQPTETALIQFLLVPKHDAEWRHQAHEDFRRAELGHSGTVSNSSLAERLFDTINDSLHGAMGSVPPAPQNQPARIDAVERRHLKEAPAKLQDHAWEVNSRVVTSAPTKPRAHSILQSVLAQWRLLDGANQLGHRQLGKSASLRLWSVVQQRSPSGMGSTWTCRELASVVDVPGPRPEDQIGPRKIELRHLPPPGDFSIGYGLYRGRWVPVELTMQAAFQHLLLQGLTGAGKGVIQLHICNHLAQKGYGFAMFFPLRQDAEKLLSALPEERLKDLVYIEVGHPRWAAPLNLLAHDGIFEDMERAVEECLNLFVRLFGDDAVQEWSKEGLRAAFWGAAVSGGHLGHAYRVFMDEQYRQRVAARVPVDEVRLVLANMKGGSEVAAPRNKLFTLLTSSPIAAMIKQPGQLDWAQIIRENRIVVVNLNQDQRNVGNLAANLAASGILNQLSRAARSIPPAERAKLKGFLAVFDEFMVVAENNEKQWKENLTQLRQFKLGIGAAGQYPSQLPPSVWDALEKSAQTRIILREEGDGAKTCARLLGGGVTPEDLAQLPALEGYSNILLAGDPLPDGRIPLAPSGVFSYRAPELLKPVRDWQEAAEQSMARWCQPRKAATGGGQTDGVNLDVD
ncbi:MAG TPA: hypothetical protein VD969_17335 [Symbiobacteriaceae bacterium]|nr:hypothetical protein [Symbiobacteriaceae bacterium]